jgi:hypothetical protein
MMTLHCLQVAHAEAGTAPLMVVCLYDFKTDDTSKLSLKKGSHPPALFTSSVDGHYVRHNQQEMRWK